MSRHGNTKKNSHHATGRKQRPVWTLLLMHLLALGIALLLYALPHHVIPRTSEAVGTVSTRAMMANANAIQQTAQPEKTVDPAALSAQETMAADHLTVDAQAAEPDTEESAALETVGTDTPEGADILTATDAPEYAEDSVYSPEPETTLAPDPTLEPVATQEPVDEVGSFRIKFADKFIEGKVQKTKNTYVSENLNIKISKGKSEEWDTMIYVVDIYVADISCFRTAFAENKYGTGYTEWPRQIAKDYKSIITMNGDQYGMRKNGVVIRNGTLYRNKKVSNDVCVLYWDGTMKTFSPKDFNANWEMANGAYQAWNFGPMLLDENGNAKTKFNSAITEKNPRSALGYFEPGHYCFVAVDGRNDESDGLSMKDLAELMEKLGCKQAYNLDGGRTSMLYAGEDLINKPADGGRKATDILMILDYVTE